MKHGTSLVLGFCVCFHYVIVNLPIYQFDLVRLKFNQLNNRSMVTLTLICSSMLVEQLYNKTYYSRPIEWWLSIEWVYNPRYWMWIGKAQILIKKTGDTFNHWFYSSRQLFYVDAPCGYVLKGRIYLNHFNRQLYKKVDMSLSLSQMTSQWYPFTWFSPTHLEAWNPFSQYDKTLLAIYLVSSVG